MSFNIKRLLNIAGTFLGVLGIGFVLVKLDQYYAEFNWSKLSFFDYSLLISYALLYAMINFFLIYAWYEILLSLKVPVKFFDAVKIYSDSLLGKYIPGNIFQFAGRQALGMSKGLPAKSLAQATLLEALLIIFVGGLFSILLLPLYFNFDSILSLAILFGSFLVVVGFGKLFFLKWSGFLNAIIHYLIFLSITGLIFAGMVHLITPEQVDLPPLSVVVGSYVIAWLVGLVTPGAPAGIGVREAVVIFLLGSMVPEAYFLMAVLLCRVVTVSGDVVVFMMTKSAHYYISKRNRSV